MGVVQGHIGVIEDGVLLEEEQLLIFDGLNRKVENKNVTPVNYVRIIVVGYGSS